MRRFKLSNEAPPQLWGVSRILASYLTRPWTPSVARKIHHLTSLDRVVDRCDNEELTDRLYEMADHYLSIEDTIKEREAEERFLMQVRTYIRVTDRQREIREDVQRQAEAKYRAKAWQKKFVEAALSGNGEWQELEREFKAADLVPYFGVEYSSEIRAEREKIMAAKTLSTRHIKKAPTVAKPPHEHGPVIARIIYDNNKFDTIHKCGCVAKGAGEPDGKRVITGAETVNNFGRTVVRFSLKDVLETADTLPWVFNNGRQRTFLTTAKGRINDNYFVVRSAKGRKPSRLKLLQSK